MMDHKLLEVNDIYKQYGKKGVVKGVSLWVKEGEIIGLLGPNGAGKTTTFYSIVGLEKISKGSIFFNGIQIDKMPMYKRARLGINYLPQETSIFRKLNVEDNIMAILEIKIKDKNIQKENLERLLGFLNITHLRKEMGFSLSGGEKRRVEIARALATQPKILLLDEPFAGIDPVTIIEIQSTIKKLVQEFNVSVIITDHNVRETLRITDYAYIIVDGKIFKSGTPKELASSKEVQEIYLGEDFTL